ncbi:uncharacterized protein LOC8024882 [Ixodes scapularis]|uniref:uncharacterized protein LOC8024882 n=1 Tax=Ixodes scapularis TaxID=6945 RepID=UPI001C394A87|nr:uncharacterized protein LOC8024882 [Ixodes scapularis]
MSVKFVSVRSALVLLDHLLSILVVTPLVVVYWRGLWMLLDALVLPESPIVSGWVTFICGQLLMLWFHLMQESLDVLGKSNPHLFMVVSRTYTQVMGVAVITQWRGLWLLVDLYTDVNLPSALSSLGVGVAGLVIAGSLSTVPNAPPFVFLPDMQEDYFSCPSRFNTSPSKALWPFFWDNVLTVAVFQPLLISAWRGLWSLLDIIQDPDDLERSARMSLFSGTLVTLLLFVSQPLAAFISRNLGRVCRRVFEGIWNLAATYATIAVWRGIWMITDEYLGEDVLSYAFAAVASICVLQTFYGANTVLTRGVIVDGDKDDGSEVYFYVDFLPLLVPEDDKKIKGDYIAVKKMHDPAFV